MRAHFGLTLLFSTVLLTACSGTSEVKQPEAPNQPSTSQSQPLEINKTLQHKASKGDLESQFQLGSLYFTAKPEKDLKQAEYWWKQAADRGHPNAAVSLAYLYTGRNDPAFSNQALMLKYLNQSSAGGNPMAQHILGTLYQRGEQGVPQDPAQARRLFQSACQQNYAPSCKALGN
jgi:TPR repeat protein